MACSPCETNFQGMTSVIVSVIKSGTAANVYVQNAGRNIIHLRRLVFCHTTGTVSGLIYVRPGTSAWLGAEYLEPGATQLYYQLGGIPAGYTVSAQVEYVEISGRSRSCNTTF